MSSKRTTTSLGGHLTSQHGIAETTSPVPTDEPSTSRDESELYEPLTKKRKQTNLDSYVVRKHSLKEELIHFICASNMPLIQVATFEPLRRVLCLAYPSDSKPPRSVATLRKYLEKEADHVRSHLSSTFSNFRVEGEDFGCMILSIWFDVSSEPFRDL